MLHDKKDGIYSLYLREGKGKYSKARDVRLSEIFKKKDKCKWTDAVMQMTVVLLGTVFSVEDHTWFVLIWFDSCDFI